MDKLVIWEIVGATGEWAGAVAVVFSLLYLARQIRASTRQSRSAARFSFLEAYNNTNASIFQSREASSVYRKGFLGELTDPDDEFQFTLMLANFMNTWSVLYELFQEGELPESVWEMVSSDINAAVSSPGGSKFWAELGKSAMNQDFIQFVDSLASRQNEAYVFPPPNE